MPRLSSNEQFVDRLHIHCSVCGGALEAQVGPPNPALTTPVRWTCPYCRAEHLTGFGGDLHGITKRFETRRHH